MSNDFRFLEFRVDKNGIKKMTQEELANELELTRSRIVALEQKADVIPNKDDLQAYCRYFNTTSDYLLGISDIKVADENIAMISKSTGLNEDSINTLKYLKKEQCIYNDIKILN